MITNFELEDKQFAILLTSCLGWPWHLAHSYDITLPIFQFEFATQFPEKVCDTQQNSAFSYIHTQHIFLYLKSQAGFHLLGPEKTELCVKISVTNSSIFILHPSRISHKQKHTHTLLCLLTIPADIRKCIPLYFDLVSLPISGRLISLF